MGNDAPAFTHHHRVRRFWNSWLIRTFLITQEMAFKHLTHPDFIQPLIQWSSLEVKEISVAFKYSVFLCSMKYLWLNKQKNRSQDSEMINLTCYLLKVFSHLKVQIKVRAKVHIFVILLHVIWLDLVSHSHSGSGLKAFIYCIGSPFWIECKEHPFEWRQ